MQANKTLSSAGCEIDGYKQLINLKAEFAGKEEAETATS